MKSLIVLIMLAAAAAAQPQPAATLAVEVVAPHGELDDAAIKGAIARELDVAVVEPSSAHVLGTLRVEVDGTVVRVTYAPLAGDSITRELALPALASDRVQLVAFAAANMIRDQVSELLAQLSQPLPPPPPPLVIPAPATISPAPDVEVPATIGFVPPLALDRIAGDRVIVGAGLHALVGANDGSRYASISGLVDRERDFADGMQLAGLAAVAGRAHGAQIGGIASIAGPADGLQLAGIASVATRSEGLQIGGVASITRSMHGLQIGGVASVATRVDGMQIGGVANIGGDVHGAQIGLVNVADDLHGLQVGLVNISDGDDDAYPIGLFNYSRSAGIAMDAWGESTRFAGLALRHGPRHLHNVWTVGWSADYSHTLVGAGLGTTLRIADRAGIDIDAVHWWTSVWTGSSNQIDQLRATLAVPIGPIDLLAGAAANIYVGDGMDENAGFHPVLERTLSGATASMQVVGWPSLFAGVRVHAR
ncbi:MAG TPA: hypothetical protein VGL61_13280 [Kofleriaceae bacterium]|jgi:hypothetical protein